MVIATDQTDARAYAGHLARITGEVADGRAVRRRRRERPDRRVLRGRLALDGRGPDGLGGRRRAAARRRRLRDEHRDAAVLRAGGRPVRARPPPRRDRVGLPAERAAAARAGQHARARARPRAGPAEDRRGAGRRVGPEDALLDAANRERNGADEIGPDGKQGAFEALEAQASFDRVLFDGGEFGTGAEIGSDEELDFLGLPGLLDADQVSALLRQRQADQISGRKRRAASTAEALGRDGPPQAGRAAQGAVAAGGRVGAQERSAARVGAQRAAPPVRRAGGRRWRTRTSSRRGSRWSAAGSSARSDRRLHEHRAITSRSR